MRHIKDIIRFLRSGDSVETEEGLLIHGGLMARGRYYHTVNGEDERIDTNLIPTEGILYLLEAGLGTNSFDSAHYLALYVGNATPLSTWTAANFATNATESTSGTDGYSESVRQTWTVGAAAPSGGGGAIDNLASRATFTIATPTTVTLYGAGLLSSSVKGGTAGVLVSATRFSATRVLNDTDTFELGYQVELTDS